MSELWERWVGSTTPPVACTKRQAKIHKRGVRTWIAYPDEINGTRVIVEMPDNAPTKSCDQDRHDDCPHRLGGPQQGGVLLKLGLPGFLWRCGCPCHNDPAAPGGCSSPHPLGQSPNARGWPASFLPVRSRRRAASAECPPAAGIRLRAPSPINRSAGRPV